MRRNRYADSPEFEELLREALKDYVRESGRPSCPSPERWAELRTQASADFAARPWWRQTLLGWSRTEWQLWCLVQRHTLRRLRESWWQ
jgi:hypothetical protein